MKIAYTTALLFVVGLLAGCVSFPKTHDEFRTKAAGVHTFVVDHPLESAYQLVAKNTIRCHEGDSMSMVPAAGSFMVTAGVANRLEGSLDERTGKAVVAVRYFSPTAPGLLQVIDLERIGPNQTRVVVHRLNDTTKWKTATASVQEWFSGGTSCFRML